MTSITGPIDAVLLDVGGVFLLPRKDDVLAALGPFGADAAQLLAGHYAGVAAMDAAGYFDWRVYATAYVDVAGVPRQQRADAAAALDAILMQPGLWTDVIPGSVSSLEHLAATGVPIGIVSNADGTVEAELLANKVCQVGEGECTNVAVVVDSTVAGMEKPDPRIFTVALEALGAAPERVVMVGDTVHTDVHGARAAGIHPLHLDPYDFCPAPDDHAHVRSLDDVAELVVSSRRA